MTRRPMRSNRVGHLLILVLVALLATAMPAAAMGGVGEVTREPARTHAELQMEIEDIIISYDETAGEPVEEVEVGASFTVFAVAVGESGGGTPVFVSDWASDDPEVITIEPDPSFEDRAELEVVGHGEATISMVFDGETYEHVVRAETAIDECDEDDDRDPCQEVEDEGPGWLVDAIDAVADGIMDFTLSMVAIGATFWMEIPSPNVQSGDGDASIGAGERPASMEGLTRLVGWIRWGGLGICVASLAIAASSMWMTHRRGDPVSSMGRMGPILVATGVLAGASSLAATFLPMSGPTDGSGVVAMLQNAVWWPMMLFAVAMLIVGAINIAWTQRFSSVRDTVRAIITLAAVSFAGLTALTILINAADGWADWIVDQAADGNLRDSLEHHIGDSLAEANTAMLRLMWGVVMFILLAFSSIIQAIIMLVRYGVLQMLAGLLPLVASLTFTEWGKQWWRRYLGWLIAFVLYKPAAAVVYATGLLLFDADFRVDPYVDNWVGMLSGGMMLLLAVFTLPALMRIAAPPVTAGSGGGGAMAGMMSGMIASGAMVAATGGAGAAMGAMGAAGSAASGGAAAAGQAGSGGSAGGGSGSAGDQSGDGGGSAGGGGQSADGSSGGGSDGSSAAGSVGDASGADGGRGAGGSGDGGSSAGGSGGGGQAGSGSAQGSSSAGGGSSAGPSGSSSGGGGQSGDGSAGGGSSGSGGSGGAGPSGSGRSGGPAPGGGSAGGSGGGPGGANPAGGASGGGTSGSGGSGSGGSGGSSAGPSGSGPSGSGSGSAGGSSGGRRFNPPPVGGASGNSDEDDDAGPRGAG